MHITEIPEESKVRVIAQANGNIIEFRSVVRQVLETSILIDEITTKDGVPISLASDKISISLQYVNGDTNLVLWQNIIVKHVRNNSGSFHQIFQTSDGASGNRRNSYRLYIGEPAQLRTGISKEVKNVILKDISSTGYGFVSDTDLEISNNTMCTILSFIDNKHISLTGYLVRTEYLEESSRYVYGCKLSARSKELEKFIMIKQREILQKKNGR